MSRAISSSKSKFSTGGGLIAVVVGLLLVAVLLLLGMSAFGGSGTGGSASSANPSILSRSSAETQIKLCAEGRDSSYGNPPSPAQQATCVSELAGQISAEAPPFPVEGPEPDPVHAVSLRACRLRTGRPRTQPLAHGTSRMGLVKWTRVDAAPAVRIDDSGIMSRCPTKLIPTTEWSPECSASRVAFFFVTAHLSVTGTPTPGTCPEGMSKITSSHHRRSPANSGKNSAS